MLRKVLVVTSTSGFDDLIVQALKETGTYNVTLVSSAAEAIGLVQESKFDLAVLDSDLEDLHYADLVHALRKVAPEMRLILVPPQDGEHALSHTHLDVQGFLNKRFYVPDLLEMADKLSMPPTKPAPDLVPTVVQSRKNAEAPAWLEDVSRAAQQLTALSLGTSAQAALIVRSGQLWAYAGQLPQPAAQELAALVANYWAQEREMPPGAHRSGTKSDLARFTRLGATGGEYMIYATSLGNGLILALAFDAETPFSKIRSQANQLARGLALPPGASLQTSTSATLKLPVVETRPAVFDRAGSPPRKPVSDIPDLSENWLSMDRLAKELFTEEEDETLEAEPTAPVRQQEPLRTEQERLTTPARIVPIADPTPRIVMEPVLPGMVNLVYACVIIPRLPQHLMTGDLVERLMEWIGQLCLAFAWRLEYLSIAPEYVQWVVNVPPTTSPSYLMRILRQHTSQRIFAEFPDLARANPSGDFWAPGYLIMSSQNPPPEPVIKDFIQQIRHHQGAYNPFPPR